MTEPADNVRPLHPDELVLPRLLAALDRCGETDRATLLTGFDVFVLIELMNECAEVEHRPESDPTYTAVWDEFRGRKWVGTGQK